MNWWAAKAFKLCQETGYRLAVCFVAELGGYIIPDHNRACPFSLSQGHEISHATPKFHKHMTLAFLEGKLWHRGFCIESFKRCLCNEIIVGFEGENKSLISSYHVLFLLSCLRFTNFFIRTTSSFSLLSLSSLLNIASARLSSAVYIWLSFLSLTASMRLCLDPLIT